MPDAHCVGSVSREHGTICVAFASANVSLRDGNVFTINNIKKTL